MSECRICPECGSPSEHYDIFPMYILLAYGEYIANFEREWYCNECEDYFLEECGSIVIDLDDITDWESK